MPIMWWRAIGHRRRRRRTRCCGGTTSAAKPKTSIRSERTGWGSSSYRAAIRGPMRSFSGSGCGPTTCSLALRAWPVPLRGCRRRSRRSAGSWCRSRDGFSACGAGGLATRIGGRGARLLAQHPTAVLGTGRGALTQGGRRNTEDSWKTGAVCLRSSSRSARGPREPHQQGWRHPVHGERSAKRPT